MTAPDANGWRATDDDMGRDGEEFLALLSNGWRVILQEPPNAERYAWYFCWADISLPVRRTFPPEQLANYRPTITHYMPLPDPPA